MRFNPLEVRLSIGKKLRNFVQCEAKKEILVKSGLREVRFNSCKATLCEMMSHQFDYALLDIFLRFRKRTFITPLLALFSLVKAILIIQKPKQFNDKHKK